MASPMFYAVTQFAFIKTSLSALGREQGRWGWGAISIMEHTAIMPVYVHTPYPAYNYTADEQVKSTLHLFPDPDKPISK